MDVELSVVNGYVFTGKTWERLNIGISDGKIAYIGDAIPHSGREINAKGRLVMPAFFNTHTHIAMTLLRNYGEGMCLHDWLSKLIWPAESKIDEEDLYYASIVGIAEMIRSGTVGINDMYKKGIRNIAKALNLFHAKGLVSYGILGNDRSELVTAEREAKSFSFKNVKPAISAHAPYSVSEELLIESFNLSKKMGLHFHIHAAETRKEVFDLLREKGLRPIEYLSKLGILDEKTIIAHGSWVTVREIKLVGESNATVASCPVSNLKLATGGICPIEEYAEAGANVTLATDGPSSNNNIDMIETMKIAGLLQKHKYWDALRGRPNEIIEFSTKNGANALGFKSGIIKVGYDADILIINPKENMRPLFDPSTAVVYSMRRDNVETVISNGFPILHKGAFDDSIVDELDRAIDYVDVRASEITGKEVLI